MTAALDAKKRPREAEKETDDEPASKRGVRELLECPVCTLLMKSAVTTKCGHSVCLGCSRRLLKKQCPLCRAPASQWSENVTVRQMVARLYPHEVATTENPKEDPFAVIKTMQTKYPGLTIRWDDHLNDAERLYFLQEVEFQIRVHQKKRLVISAPGFFVFHSAGPLESMTTSAPPPFFAMASVGCVAVVWSPSLHMLRNVPGTSRVICKKDS